MAINAKVSEISSELDELVTWLASFGRTNNGGVTRLLYSSAWLLAQQSLKRKMEYFGLGTYFDDTGNLFGRLSGTEKSAQTILTGSHIDTVIDGGKYDGAYGVIASMLAVRNLLQQYGPPKKTIEVVSLCEEEGSRFPLAFWGSGSITGKHTIEDIKTLRDISGLSFADAMRGAGFGRGVHCNPKRNDLDCFIELHVEQGFILEKEGCSLGVISHIVGQRRFTIYVAGESNHAGTTPMRYRKDAISTAAELITYITQKAIETDPDLVATIGKISASPNVPNVIAGEAMFTLDIRHHHESLLEHFCSKLFAYFEDVSNQRGLQITAEQWMNARPVKMDATLNELANKIATEQNIPFLNMVSGAGHDAQVFGEYCPTALLFVPSHKGISHSPKEFTESKDLENGLCMLTELLYRLAY